MKTTTRGVKTVAMRERLNSTLSAIEAAGDCSPIGRIKERMENY